MLPGTGPDTPAVVVTVAGPDGCAFVHPARKAVTIRMHAQRIGKNDLFICFHRLLALSGAPEISCDDDKKPAEKQVLMNVLIHPFLAGEQPDSTIFDPFKSGSAVFIASLTFRHSEAMEHGNIRVP